MMNLKLNSKTDKLLLTVNSGEYLYENPDCIFDVSMRFLQASRQCPPNGFLGIHAVYDAEQPPQLFTFSAPEMKLGQGDNEWIFSDYAVVSEAPQAARSLDGEGRCVYAVRQIAPYQAQGEADDCDLHGEGATRKERRMLLQELRRVGAVLQVISGGSSEYNVILLGISCPLSLKLRTMFSYFIPGVVFEQLTDGTELSAASKPLADKALLKFTIELLSDIMHNTPKQEQELDDDFGLDYFELDDEDFEDDEPDDDISSLNFSVRTYNALKRGGVHSVQQLRKMSDRELMAIRNFSRKCLAEVREKLSFSEQQTQTESVPEPEPAPSALDELTKLIGLQNVKAQVRKISAYAKMKKDLKTMNKNAASVVLNMEFVGNPGTGKTTVARILAGIFYETGLLTDKELIEVGRSDLVGKYVGHTAVQVKNVFEKAGGKVLFIDEAYSLADGGRGDFGDEAINTIVQEMENRRDDTIVIFAGYTDEMKRFFERNPGLRSRVPFRVEFNDYSAEEMVQITENEVEKRGFALSDSARKKVISVCSSAVRQKESGNGRFCRNLAEGAVLCYAERVYGGVSEDESAKDFVLHAEDFKDTPEAKEEKQNNIIGFCA